MNLNHTPKSRDARKGIPAKYFMGKFNKYLTTILSIIVFIIVNGSAENIKADCVGQLSLQFEGSFHSQLRNLPFCECGCGHQLKYPKSKRTLKNWRWRGIPKYIKGHWQKGRKHSEATKAKLSIAMKEATKAKLSIAMKEATKAKLSIIMRGERNGSWKGGITPLRKKIRKSLEYRAWRKAVFARDNFACIWCGDDRGGNLQADHYPKSLSQIIDKLKNKYGIENLYENAMQCELLWDIKNGRTLCEPCHRKTDTFGRG